MRRSWVVAVSLGLLVACGGESPRVAPSASPSSSPSSSDPAYVVARIALGDSVQPCGVVGDGTAVWVSGFGSNLLYRIDPATYAVTDRVPVGVSPCGLAFGAGSVWTSDYGSASVTRVDVATRKVVATVKVGDKPFDAAFGAGSAWVTNGGDGTVSRISPATNAVVATIPVGSSPAGVAVVGDSAWVPVGNGDVVRIDARTGKVRGRVATGGGMATWLSHGDGSLWVASPNDGAMTEIDVARGRVLGRATGFTRPADGDILGGDLWVPLRGTSGLVRISRATRRSVPVPLPLLDGFVLAGAFGSVWVPDFGGTDVLVVRPDIAPKP